MAVANPWNTTLQIDDVQLPAFSTQVGLSSIADATGRPAIGTVFCSMDFAIDIHDTKAVPFPALQKLFHLANIATSEKIKPIKITFWADEHRHDAICTMSFTGWISSWNISSGGGSNHTLAISVQPSLNEKQYHDLMLGN